MNNIGGIYLFIVLIGGLFSHFSLQAQTMSAELDSLQESSKIIVRGDVNYYSSNELTNAKSNQVMEAIINIDYKINYGTVYVNLSGSQDMTSNKNKTQMNNTSFGFKLKPYKLTDSLLVISKFYSYLPTNKDNRELESY